MDRQWHNDQKVRAYSDREVARVKTICQECGEDMFVDEWEVIRMCETCKSEYKKKEGEDD